MESTFNLKKGARLLYRSGLVLFFLMGFAALHAQHTISGTILDEDGQTPLIGVNIVEADDPTNGTITDFNGYFKMEVSSPDDELVVSYVGYEEQRIALEGRSSLEFNMSSGLALSEVVVTALGIERDKKTLGYAMQELDSDKLTNVLPSNALNGLAGKVAGLTTVSASNGLTSSTRVVLRGENSLNINNNSPLIVVDGIPINNQIFGVGGGSTDQSNMPTDYGNGAAEINPNDIESVNVLKGAAASALYGSRGANGVILITTKSGKGQQGLGVQVSSTTLFSNPLVLPEQQTEYGGGWGLTYYADYGTNFGPALDGSTTIAQDGSPGFEDGETLPFVHRYNIEDFFETGLETNNQISISGGFDKGSIRFSYGNRYSEGMVPNTNLKRNNFSFNSNYNLSDKWKVNLSGNYIKSKSDNVPVAGYGSQGIMYVLLWNYNNVDMDWYKDYWREGAEGSAQDYIFSWADNPYLIANENINGFDKDRIFGRVSTEFQLTPQLSLMLRSGTDYSDDLRISRRPVGAQRYPNGMYREQNINFREINSDFLLKYQERFADFSTVISAGANRMNQTITENFIEGRGLSIPEIYTLGNINVLPDINRYEGEKRVNSVYGFANLGYKDFLYLDVTARNDWSSTLPKEDNSYFYPSASLSFIPSEIFEMGAFVDYLKVRFNWAQVGNDTDPYSLRSTYQFASLPNSVSNPSRLPNENLSPELTTSWEFGLQTYLLDRRINLDFTYYNATTEDQIIAAGISEASGFTTRVINAGEIESQGIEIAMNLTPVRMDNSLTWDIGLNFSRNRSEVISLAPGVETFIIANGPGGATVEARPGERMGEIYGNVFQRENGEIVFNSSGLPELDPERQSIGNYNPDYMIGASTSLRYKGIFANALFDIRQGGVIYSYTNAIGAESGILTHSLPGREEGIVGDGVMLGPDGSYVPNTTVTAPETWYYGGYYNRSNVEANSFDASYVKLRELSIGYQLPTSITEKLKLGRLSVAFIGRNVALWTDVPNIDPEAQALNGGTLVPGFEVTQLPTAQSFGFKLDASF